MTNPDLERLLELTTILDRNHNVRDLKLTQMAVEFEQLKQKIEKALEIEDKIREWFTDYFNQSPLEECEITIRDKLQSILGEKK